MAMRPMTQETTEVDGRLACLRLLLAAAVDPERIESLKAEIDEVLEARRRLTNG